MRKMVVSILCFSVLMTAAVASAEEVWVTSKGNKYHMATCPLIKNKETMKMEKAAAEQQGLEPCARCFKAKTEKSVGSKDNGKIKKIDK